jgi:phosphate transport system permease protein
MVSVSTTLGIIIVLGYETSAFFAQVSITEFLFDSQWTPLFVDNRHFGIWPLVSGTFLTSFLALLIAIPIGLLLAIYLCEFAGPKTRRILKPFLEILAGVPTVVYGYFALLTVTPFLQRIFPGLGGFNALSPGLVMGIMILPIVASLSEDALYAVPRSMKEGAYALGSTKLQMIAKVLIPSALGGISAAFILGMSRAVGETMIVAIAAGQQATFSLNPMEPLQTMTAYIVQISLGDTPHGTLEFQTIFAVAGVLFLVTFALNFISLKMRERYEHSLKG